MKRYILFFIIFILFFGSISLVSADYNGVEVEGAGLTSSSVFYSVDKLFDNLNIFLSFRWQGKVSSIKNIIEERLLELIVLVNKDIIREDDVSNTLELVENNLDDIFTIIKDRSLDDSDYIERNISGLYNFFIIFDNNIDKMEEELINEISYIIESIEEEGADTSRLLNKVNDYLNRIIFINDLSKSLETVFYNNRLSFINLIAKENQNSLLEDYRNDNFENLREEADVYDLNLPTGFFMTLDSSSEKETVDRLRLVINESKEDKIEKLFSHLHLIEAELYGEKNQDNLSINQWNTYERFISEARAEFNAGNFEEAENLAQQSKQHIITILE